MRSPLRDAGAPRSAQARAALLVASTIMTLQKQSTARILYGDGCSDVRGRTAMLTWMCDETKQRIKVSFEVQHEGLRAPRMHTSVDVLVAQGRQLEFHFDDSPSEESLYYPKSLQLYGKNTAFLLEGLKRQLPIKMFEPGVLLDVATANEEFVIAFGTDRCTTEFSMLRVVWNHIHYSAPLNVTPHAEPCGTHGGALVKAMAPSLRDVMKMLHGWSRLVRQGKFLSDAHKYIYRQLSASATVVLGQPSEDVKQPRQVGPLCSTFGVAFMSRVFVF